MSPDNWRKIGLFSVIAIVLSFFDMSLGRRVVLMAMAVLGITAAPKIAAIVNDWT